MVVCLLVLAGVAHGEPWYRQRRTHLVLTGVGAVAYLVIDRGAPASCRWCSDNALDRPVSNALAWHDTHAAETLSGVTAYIGVPLVAATLALDSDDLIGDGLPVVEAGVAAELLTSGAKWSFARRRPDGSDNRSFWSSHASLAFALATSAGVVAHHRHARAEAVIWGAGLTLAATTAYFRLAGDRHYLTDVLAGSAVGIGVGIAVPRFTLVPLDQGVAVAGAF